MQAVQAINVGGRITQTQFQYTLQDPDLQELYHWADVMTSEMKRLPQVRDVILLIGIVKKNAIIMIDFALAAQRGGRASPQEASIEACVLRFRPITMTTLCALLGALPLALGTGVGSDLRRPLCIAIVGGLCVSQLLTLYTTPVIYLYMMRVGAAVAAARAWLAGRPADVPHRIPAE